MAHFQSEMFDLEKKFKSQIEGKVANQLNKAKESKDKYERAAGSVDDLAAQIKEIVAKFDRIKDEIGQSSKKMEQYKESVEQNNLEIALLETEIKNLELKADKKRALQEEISVEGGKLRK
jgi:methyl-accepting chemotaxis protein